MGEKQRVESVHYFPFFPFFTRRNFRVLAIFVFFPSFLGYSLALFCLFCALGQLRSMVLQLQFLFFFVTGVYWGGFGGRKGMNGFLGGNAFFRRWVRRG